MAIIVLAHGAWSAAWAWKKMRPLMAAAGHEFLAPSYTGLGERAHLASPNNDLDTHIQDLLGVLKFENLRNVVLVGHSYGGSVITEAGADPKVSALVYVAALQPDVGEASGQLLSKFAAPNDAMRATPDKYFYLPPAKFHENFAADVSPSEAQFMADSQDPLAEKALGAQVSVAAWRTKPSYAILTTQDHMVSPQLQRWMYQRSGAKVTEVSASHAVFISQPAAVAQVIEAAAK